MRRYNETLSRQVLKNDSVMVFALAFVPRKDVDTKMSLCWGWPASNKTFLFFPFTINGWKRLDTKLQNDKDFSQIGKSQLRSIKSRFSKWLWKRESRYCIEWLIHCQPLHTKWVFYLVKDLKSVQCYGCICEALLFKSVDVNNPQLLSNKNGWPPTAIYCVVLLKGFSDIGGTISVVCIDVGLIEYPFPLLSSAKVNLCQTFSFWIPNR